MEMEPVMWVSCGYDGEGDERGSYFRVNKFRICTIHIFV